MLKELSDLFPEIHPLLRVHGLDVPGKQSDNGWWWFGEIQQANLIPGHSPIHLNLQRLVMNYVSRVSRFGKSI